MGIHVAILKKSFQITCIWLVLFMVYQQFKLYMNNEDSSSVSYRAFNQEEKDLYPSFSICLHSDKGGILKPRYSKNPYEAYSDIDKYHQILLGHDNIHNEHDTFYNSEYSEAKFDDMALDVLKDFVDYSISLIQIGTEHVFLNNSDNSLFYKSYQDPYFRCISKSVYFTKNKIIDDIVVLNATDLYDHIRNMKTFLNITTDVIIYVHHRNQLVRELGKKILILTEEDFEKAINGSNDYREIQFSQVEVLRKREDKRSKERCDPNLDDDDKMWREKVMEAVKCIPVYWKGLYSDQNMKLLNLRECNSSIQYEYIWHNFLPPTVHLDNGTNLYKDSGPCNQMKVISSISSTSNKLTDIVSNSLTLGFRYYAEEYREIVNREAFGKWSNFMFRNELKIG